MLHLLKLHHARFHIIINMACNTFCYVLQLVLVCLCRTALTLMEQLPLVEKLQTSEGK